MIDPTFRYYIISINQPKEVNKEKKAIRSKFCDWWVDIIGAREFFL